MQVSNQADHITHAVIGGAKTREFEISNSAAFFQILSSTLYSNQRLAVAREVLCNAWDAHIRAGKQDVPIVVTIYDDKLVVRDQGAGIHDDMMGPLYGTYGGSDKTNNGTETGGFGLGCKSPFAYGDHFEVISWHQGMKTVYNLSKSSADKFGKPGITTIVSIPTQETGLQVTIPVKCKSDSIAFKDLFENVAHNGEMNVEIDGKKIIGLPISASEFNWLITKEKPLDHSGVVFIRYGNVIYPVDSHQAYKDIYYNIINFIERLNTVRYGVQGYRIIFQAEPDTISVTPSRESLSMQEHTINTLKGLFAGFFIKDLDAIIAKESLELLDSQILKVTEEKHIGELMTNEKKIPGFSSIKQVRDLDNINSIKDLAKQYVIKMYPKHKGFYQRDMGLRIDMAISLGVGKRGHLETVKKQVTNPKIFKNLNVHEWFKKTIVRPLVRDISAHPALDLKRLSILIDSYEHYDLPMKYWRDSLSAYLPILRNILVITYTKRDLRNRLQSNADLKRMGGEDNIWVYHAPFAKTRIEATREFFKTKGFFVIDLTVEEEVAKTRVEKKLPDPDKPKVPRPTGYASLSGAIKSGIMTRVDNCFLADSPRVHQPKCFYYVRVSKAEHREFSLGSFSSDQAYIITKLFGNDCAMVRVDVQREKLKKEGLMELNEYVISYVLKTVSTSPSFLAYWSEDLNRALGEKTGKTLDRYKKVGIFSLMLDTEEVRVALGLKHSLNEHDLMVLSIWRHIAAEGAGIFRRDNKDIEAAGKLIEALPIDKTIRELIKNTANNPFCNLIDIDQFQKIVSSPTAKADGHFDRLAKIIKIALLG